MTDKRRLISLLPQTNQTADLKAFFGASVDMVFQPGVADKISGFIGHPLPNNTDFFVGEPSTTRSFYQLEPAMVSYDAINPSQINYSLSYPDLVSYFSVAGANVSDQQRLFETNYYVWSPPINVDMLLNFNQYYWFGDLLPSNTVSYTFNPADSSPSVTLSQGNLTAAIPAGTGSVRSVPLPSGAFYIEFTIPPQASTAIQLLGLANATDSIGRSPGTRTSGNNAVVISSDGHIYNDTGSPISATVSPFGPGDVISMAWNTTNKRIWFAVNNGSWDDISDNPTTGSGGFDLTTLLSNLPACAVWTGTGAGCQVSVNFGASTFVYNPPLGYVGPASLLPVADQPTVLLEVPIALYTGDGSTTVFALPPSAACVPSSAETPTGYVNNVPQTATSDGTNLTFASPPTAGSALMVCRTPSLIAVISGQPTVNVNDLNTQGVDMLTSSMRIKVVDCAHLSDAWDSRPWDESIWDASDDAVYMVDGIGTSARFTPRAAMVTGLAPQYVTIDRSSLDQNPWSLRNSWVHAAAFAFAGQNFPERRANRPIIEFVRDIVRYPNQVWSENSDPLFMLYDVENRALNDPYYTDSTFAGNRIFGYATGNGPNDPVLQRPLAYDSNGYIRFSNDSALQQYVYTANRETLPINGLTSYAQMNSSLMASSYTCFWAPAAGTTIQLQTNGLYTIPVNLSANPDYEEVGLISKSTWTSHFTSILSGQIGFSGNAVGTNNYRDTARDPTLGTVILQHDSPLLKTMLLASSEQFDLLRASRYVETEYTRFRNKFLRKLVDFSNRGVLAPTASATDWLFAVLSKLVIGQNLSFPFAYSTSAPDQFFIPATPSMLGMWPGTLPQIITDTTYGAAVSMLLGHDGSLTPLYNDWRDPILLALETYLYNNSSILQPVNYPAFDIRKWIGGAFYSPSNGYQFSELLAILAPMFELWAQTNRIDYRANTSYDPSNRFTWNYRGVTDRYGNSLPGGWRAIYRFYYGTDSPHTRPWEMLGYTYEPSWWVSKYGAAPYLRSNQQMWSDLAAGLNGINQSTADPMFARPDLLNIIPVDDAGNLLDPTAIGIVLTTVTPSLAARDWQAGDIGPGESLWWYSSAWRFAMARAAFLMKPARFAEQCWDASRIGYDDGFQWLYLPVGLNGNNAHQRPINATLQVHGETDANGQIVQTVGYSQWLADYLTSSGRKSSLFGDAVRGLDVSLMHQMAGFVSSSSVSVVADSFGLLPSEDVQTILYTSPATSSEVYSGAIIEWTGATWRVLGFDGRSSAFTVIPPNTAGPKGLISLATAAEPAIVPWRTGTYYPVNILVSHQNSVYEALRSHTSGAHFELNFWQPRSDLATAMIRAPRVVTYLNGLADTTITVPYGTEYTTYQDVADFLLGYERWLISRGWVFDQVDAAGNILDWSLSVREFLQWAQVQWTAGNFIAVSPGQALLQFVAPQGTILNVEDNTTGFYGLTDRSGQPISERDAVVSRLDGTMTLAATNADIFLARLDLCNVEHALVFNNTTIFDDVVYLPLYNLRQQRLNLTCSRAQNWQGRLDAPGFVINGATLASSFEKVASDIRLMFDIERADTGALRDYARHDVGMQERSYLSALLMSDTEQFEFYQGMIQEKGTPGVFQKLTRSNLVSDNSILEFLDEWAVRVGDFGSPTDPFVTFQLTQSDVRNDPQMVRFVQEAATPPDWIELAANDSRWYDKPSDVNSFFPERTDYAPSVYPSAGPVRINEVGNAIFHLTDVTTLYDPNLNSLPSGSRIWVYDAPASASGTNWYVDAVTGNDSNPGTSTAQPFATLQAAHDVCNPGDIIHVADGVYTVSSGTNVLEITRSGTPSAPISFQALPGANPQIIGAQSFAAVHFNAVSYVSLQGFEVAGWNQTLLISDVQSALISGGAGLALYNGAGIVVDRGTGTAMSHHIEIRDCVVHDFPYSGILVNWADYVTIRGCRTFSNAKYSPLSGAGITVLNSHGIDNQRGYKTFVQQNISYNNLNMVTNGVTGNVTDGSGISILGNQNDQTDGVSYVARTLVENNLCYTNGGNGILVADSNHVDVVFNTVDHNQTNTNHAFGELVAFNSVDCNFSNNILYAAQSVPLATNPGSVAVAYTNNIGYGGSGAAMPGVSGFSDPLFVNPASSPPNYQLQQGSRAIGAANPLFTTNVDLANNQRTAQTGFDIGCYQSGNVQPSISGRHPYTVLHSFDIGYASSIIPNMILTVTTQTEDSTVTNTRISFQYPIAVTAEDVGNYVVIDGATLSVPELQGVQLITAVRPELNAIEIAVVGSKGSSFLTSSGSAPVVRVLRSVRFASVAAINPNYNFAVNDLVWIDDYNQGEWAVLQWLGTEWGIARQQPNRIDPMAITETVIYSAGANIVGHKMFLNQPVVPDLAVIDPLAGLICNVAARDIDFKTEYDPASYNAGFGTISAGVWGPNEVGRVWWNLASVRFIDTFTDVFGQTLNRDLAELQYRNDFWAQIAPNTSVDVYEWIASEIDPQTYAATAGSLGTVFNVAAPSWVERSVYSVAAQQDITMYYFWVSGLTTVPNVGFRTISISDIARGIANPTALNVAWMGAVSTNALLVSGVVQFLDDTTTVMKVRNSRHVLNGYIAPDAEIGHHDEWLLMRQNDSISLPTDALWLQLRDSLAGFAVAAATLVNAPDPSLPIARSTGINAGQSMFYVPQAILPPWQTNQVYYYGDQVINAGFVYQCVANGLSASSGSGPAGYSNAIADNSVLWAYYGPDTSRGGLLDARAAFVASINAVFASVAIEVDRGALVASLLRTTPIDPYLAWAQTDLSYPYEPPPNNEWDAPWEVHSLSQRNDLLANATFYAAAYSNRTISVLLNGFANAFPQWSIWQFDPAAALRVIQNNPDLPPSAAMIQNADHIFLLKTAYEFRVNNLNAAYSLSLSAGDRVLVNPAITLAPGSANPFWAIYQVPNFTLTAATMAAAEALLNLSLNTIIFVVGTGFVQVTSVAPLVLTAIPMLLWRVQTYDTSLFIETADWYAAGYSASEPPIVSYSSIAQRNATEGGNPTNQFVAVTNNGTGQFIWTQYVDSVWTTVAVGNGTIQLSAALYDPLRTLCNVSTVSSPMPLSLTNVYTRDGSWELRIIAHSLRYSTLLTESEINQVWFAMLNFCHVQQNEVEWAFKTSFMTLAGIAVPMTQTPVLQADQSKNLIDYINEVKPYRVKMREWTTQYVPAVDAANYTVTDFDDPVYFDPTLGAYRTLDPTALADQPILNSPPWTDWYQNYAISNSPVRSFTLTLVYDRVSASSGNWDMAPFDVESWDSGEGDAGAAYRLLTYYHPTVGMPPVDLTTLLNLTEHEAQISGTDFVAGTIAAIYDGGTLVPETDSIDFNPTQPSQPGGYDLRAPYYAANHPEERVPFGADDGLQITVTAQPLAGAPPQIVKVFDIGSLTGSTTTLFFDMIAQSASAVLVYCDGYRATLGTDYTVDYLNRSITLNLVVNNASVNRAVIHVFGFGGSSAVTEQHYLSYGTNTLSLSAPTSASNVAVVVGGIPLASTGYTVSGTTVSLLSPPSNGTDVALAVYAGGVASASTIYSETLTLSNVPQSSAGLFPTAVMLGSYNDWLYVTGATIISGGSGYVVGDALSTLSVSAPVGEATFQVASVGLNGSVTSVSLTTSKLIQLDAALLSLNALSGGTGSGMTVSLQGTVPTLNAQNTTLGAGFPSTVSQMTISAWISAGTPTNPPTNNDFEIKAVGSSSELLSVIVTLSHLTGTGLTVSVAVEIDAGSGVVRYSGVLGATVPVYQSGATTAYVANLLMSYDLLAQTMQVYVNDTALTISSGGWLSSGTIDTTTLAWQVLQSGASGAELAVADVWINALSVDLTISANRRQWINADLSAVTLPSDGQLASSMIPVIFLHTSSSAAAFLANGGTGNAWSLLEAGSTGYAVPLELASSAQSGVLSRAPQVWTLANPDTQTIPEHAGTIVEVNGLRLTPPITFYGSMSIGQQWMYLPLMPDNTTTIEVYVNGSLYTESIPICSSTSINSPYVFNIALPGLPPPTTVAGQFVAFDHMLVALDNNFIADSIVVVMQFSGVLPAYSVSNGVLTINPLLPNAANIVVTTFSNAATLGIQTVTYTLNAAETHVVPQPLTPSYALVTMSGKMLVPDDDFTLVSTAFATGEAYFTAPVLTLANQTSGDVVATMFTGMAAREPMMWMYTTTTPAALRMLPAPTLVDVGWDATAFDSQAYDDAQLQGVPTNNGTVPVPLFSIRDRFELLRLSPYNAGILASNLAPTDSTIAITLFAEPIASKLQDPSPLPIPDPARNVAGVIWIEGERIEYFGYAQSGESVTLSHLRRATRGTSVGTRRFTQSGVGTGASQTFTFAVSGSVDVTFDGIAQAASAFVVSGSVVTLTAPVGTYIVVGLSSTISHLAGVSVWNGRQTFYDDIPLGPPVGNRELQPMKRIITGG